MFRKVFESVKAWLLGKEEAVVVEVRKVKYVQPRPVLRLVEEVQVKKPAVHRMSWAEMKANNEMLDSYFSKQTQPALRLVA